jgi:DNA-binding GntR family transcriptional regulator
MVVIPLPKLDRTLPVRQQAADVVQDAIMKGLLRAGESLRQRTLAVQFKLSHSAVREVLLELDNRGLITKRGSTYTVARLSEQEYRDLVMMRRLLEPAACRLAAQSFRPELGAQLEACIDRMRQALARKDHVASWQHDRDFHRLIWKYQPNRILESHLDRICTQLFAFYLSHDYMNYMKSCYPQVPIKRILGEHTLILEILRTGDGDRAERIMRRILEASSRRAFQVVHEMWRDQGQNSPK